MRLFNLTEKEESAAINVIPLPPFLGIVICAVTVNENAIKDKRVKDTRVTLFIISVFCCSDKFPAKILIIYTTDMGLLINC